MPESPVLEVCCGDLASALAAVEGGAERIELCSALSLDGLTPSIGLLHELRTRFPDLKIHVLIRPCEGNFVYSEEEVSMMERDIRAAIDAGATAIVSGALLPIGAPPPVGAPLPVDSPLPAGTPPPVGAPLPVGAPPPAGTPPPVDALPPVDSPPPVGAPPTVGAVEFSSTGFSLDTPTTARLIQASGPLPFTFHRAFDLIADKATALQQLYSLGVRRILTSGGAPTAEAGIPVLQQLVQQATQLSSSTAAQPSPLPHERGQGLLILPGGGVTSANARRILQETGATEIHGSCSERLSNGLRQTSADEVRAVLKAISRTSFS